MCMSLEKICTNSTFLYANNFTQIILESLFAKIKKILNIKKNKNI